MPYLELPGVRLWFEESGGEGVPVIFLHAASGTFESWIYQLPSFIQAGYRCITYDRRGWGRSQPIGTTGQPGCGSLDLHGLVEHLGLDRFHLLATAAGGIVALDYALTYPERVRALAVANSIGGIQDPEYLAVQHRLRPSQIQELPIELRELGPSYRGTNSDGTRRWIEIERTSRQGDTHSPAQEVQSPLTRARLATMRVPTLIISGGADLLSPPALMRMLAAPIAGHQWACLPEAGHAAFWEDPEAWNRLVLDFLADR